MEKQKEQLHEIFTIGMFYLMLLCSVILITSRIDEVSIQDSTEVTPQSEVVNY